MSTISPSAIIVFSVFVWLAYFVVLTTLSSVFNTTIPVCRHCTFTAFSIVCTFTGCDTYIFNGGMIFCPYWS